MDEVRLRTRSPTFQYDNKTKINKNRDNNNNNDESSTSSDIHDSEKIETNSNNNNIIDKKNENVPVTNTKSNNTDTNNNKNKNNNSESSSKQLLEDINIDEFFNNLDNLKNLREITPIEGLAILNNTINNLKILYSLIKQGKIKQESDNKSNEEHNSNTVYLKDIIFPKDHNDSNEIKLNRFKQLLKLKAAMDCNDSSNDSLLDSESEKIADDDDDENDNGFESDIDDNDGILGEENESNEHQNESEIKGNLYDNSNSTLSSGHLVTANDDLELPLKKISKIHSNFEELTQRRSISSSSQTNVNTNIGNKKNGKIVKRLEIIKSYNDRYLINKSRTHEDCLQLINRFYLKSLPSLPVEKYLNRINQFITSSASVYITASMYLFNISFNLKSGIKSYYKDDSKNYDKKDKYLLINPLKSPESIIKMIPIEDLNIFRLILTSIRISSKLIEDKNYKQNYYCKITGLQNTNELFKLELIFLFIIDFNLITNEILILRHLYQLKLFNNNLKNFINSIK
ncbi:hypothetical protein B5S29_g5033 [[Candida] boidinii]|nr:hypothetical protein B5S29_g5033 [[Candida] boidinii]